MPNSELGTEKTFTWGLDLSQSLQGAGGVGGLLCVTARNPELGTRNAYYATYDANGNISEYLDNNGAVVAHYEYSPFGKLTVADGAKAADFDHRFSTKFFDTETSLYYYGRRYYSPVLGRWISRDPIEELGGLNLFAMVGNGPVNGFDLYGLIEGCTLLQVKTQGYNHGDRKVYFCVEGKIYYECQDGEWVLYWDGRYIVSPHERDRNRFRKRTGRFFRNAGSIIGGYYGGMWKGAQGELVAVSGGLFDKESSILAENYLGWVDTGDSQVQMGIGAQRVSVAASSAAALWAGASAWATETTAAPIIEHTTKPLVGTAFNLTVGTGYVGGPAAMNYMRAHPKQVMSATHMILGYGSQSSMPENFSQGAGALLWEWTTGKR